MYKKLDALDKIYKPLIIKWLCKIFEYKEYRHNLKDQYIQWSIFNNKINVAFDRRCEEHQKLYQHIPDRYKGTPQYNTFKIVNLEFIYIPLEIFLHLKYPKITSSRLIKRNKEKGGSGGWHSPSDDFYTYDWGVFLEEGSSIFYNNQEDKMDLEYRGYTYDSIIQEKIFTEYLNKHFNNP